MQTPIFIDTFDKHLVERGGDKRGRRKRWRLFHDFAKSRRRIWHRRRDSVLLGEHNCRLHVPGRRRRSDAGT